MPVANFLISFRKVMPVRETVRPARIQPQSQWQACPAATSSCFSHPSSLSCKHSPWGYLYVWKQRDYWCWSVCGFCHSWHLHMSGTLPYTSWPKTTHSISEYHGVLGDSASTHLERFYEKQVWFYYVGKIVQITNDTYNFFKIQTSKKLKHIPIF